MGTLTFLQRIQGSGNAQGALSKFESAVFDAKTTGPILIGTPSADFVVTQIEFYAVTMAGLVSLATISAGVTGAAYNDLLAATAIVGITGNNQKIDLVPTALKGFVPAGTGIYANVTVGGVGTTQDMIAVAIGYFK